MISARGVLAGARLARSMPMMFAWTMSWLAPAMALAAMPDPASEHAACVRLRDEGKATEAAPRCRAAYDALATEVTEAALNDRAVIVFDAHHTYQEAYQASEDRGHLCEESAVLGHFLAFLEEHVEAKARQADRRDARMLLADVHAQLGDHPCSAEAPEDELLAVSPMLMRPAPAVVETDELRRPMPPPTGTSRPLRVAGGVTLGLGLVASMATVGVLIYGESLQRARDELLHKDHMPGQVSEETLRSSARLLTEGRRANQIGATIGALAGASMISGITLLGVDAARHRRARRVALHPSAWPNLGLRASLEF